MAISGDLGIYAALGAHPFRRPPAPSKVSFSSAFMGESTILEFMPMFPLNGKNTARWPHRCHGLKNNKLFQPPANHEVEGFILDAIKMSFLDRLSLAWKILFPSPTVRKNSNARIAKQRLKMILFSDRCAVSDEAKRKIVNNIVGALSDFVEIDSQDKVQLSVSTDPDLGTVYSVTVPVRRVKPEYQDYDQEYTGITGIEYKDKGEASGSVDVTFDFYIPNEKSQ